MVASSTLCGLTRDGKGYCWGNNFAGQVGDGGSLTNRATPIEVPGNFTFAALETNGQATCGITTRSDVYCWGEGYNGLLGDGVDGYDERVTRPTKLQFK